VSRPSLAMNDHLLQPVDLTHLAGGAGRGCGPPLLPSRSRKPKQRHPPQHCNWACAVSGASTGWEISWQAEARGMLAIDFPPRQGQGSTGPSSLQDSGLAGLALVAIEQRAGSGGGAAVRGQAGEPCSRCLIIELMVPHAISFMLDGQRRVIALARPGAAATVAACGRFGSEIFTALRRLQGNLPQQSEGRRRCARLSAWCRFSLPRRPCRQPTRGSARPWPCNCR